MELTRKRIILIIAGVLILAAVIYGFWPDPILVQTESAERSPMEVVVEEEGQTEVTDRYVLSAPVTAMLQRLDVEAGDQVEAGESVAQLQAPPATLLDARARAEAQARAEGAEAAVQQAERQVDAAEAVRERAAEQRRRTERLYEQDSATRQELEQAVSEEMQATANLESARASVAQARADLMSARATLQTGLGNAQAAPASIQAPASGRILTVHRESEGVVTPGEPLLEIGDTELLSIRVDVLSQDALRIEPGTRVLLDQWGGDASLEAQVERVEPQGHTDISALGVEEQRVSVLAGMRSPQAEWQALGSGYRVLARFIIWEDSDVLQVPTGALFRTDDGWGVFVIEGGRAAHREVQVGQQSGLRAQVLSGLSENEEVIVHPPNEVEDGARVRRRDG